jgi:hypothetical protein
MRTMEKRLIGFLLHVGLRVIVFIHRLARIKLKNGKWQMNESYIESNRPDNEIDSVGDNAGVSSNKR